MAYSSRYPSLDIPQTNILDYIFPANEKPLEEPLWLDSKDDKHSLSPKQALQWVKRLAFGLERLGLEKGEVAMIYTPNHIFVPVAYLGIVGAGLIFSGANPAYTVPELVHQMKNTTAKVILAHPNFLETALEAASKAGIPKSRVFQFSDVENRTHHGIPDWRAMIGSPTEGDTYQWPDFSPKESRTAVATINYSSGTTGLPKGVCVSHSNLIANVEQTIFIRYAHKPYPFEKRPQERWIGFLPLYHAYGQLYTILMAVKLRVPIYVMKEFRYEDFLFTIGRYRITSLQIAPPILVMLSKRPETARYDLSSIKDVLCGAAPLSRELQNECQRRFNMQINQGWGMTEVTCGALHVPGGIKDDTGSVGRLDPNTECKLLDDDGKEVELGQPGEMYIRGPQVCLRYWRNEEATKECLSDDGWLKTGDIAVCNKEGFFWIVDRKKELIKVNALQVAPAELEAVLLENEHIADAAAVGITIDGEEWPRAYVVIQDASKGKITPQAVQEWIKSRVAKHKWLVGGVVFIDEVPKLASGKIQRKTMRDWAKKDAAEIAKKGSKARL
ncbi:putative 4-coumarate- ligase protein [Phaeoacremonium minimum UCRPA7]|uniref:Putative 4-coumarate-ligase protein n=1 Tax=Phaeoacremonium minimum (strain UCR-PA7) TaxID=1286976 RepID=R8BN51_PHAM7|nr:putative 4-coumarate- ligase protein [Phaeoacremonium minimum UCRPA7]EOO00769.1 putative 4-coumarate- ligase protein [Phaeoacremonium minimum UCRPA7]